MAKLVEMDDNVKFSSQLEEDVGPIVFVNKFTVNPEDFDEFLKAWEAVRSLKRRESSISFTKRCAGKNISPSIRR